MSNWMKSARSWLGLGTDPYYDDDYDEADEDYHEDVGQPAGAFADEERRVTRPTRVPSSPPPSASAASSLGPSRDWDEGDGGVRVISAGSSPGGAESESRGVVRPLPSATRPTVVTPTSFNDVQEVADGFKRSQPVIVNLQGVDRDLSRRLIDFASGLCYGLEGTMERVADQVFLLTPSGAQISDDDRRAIRDGSILAADG
jgi:cell division inhibitor SepF